MKMKFLMTASWLILACSCQQNNPTQPNQDKQSDQDMQQRQRPAGGCGSCEAEKPKPLSAIENKPASGVADVAQQPTVQTNPSMSAPADKTEAKSQ